MSRVTNNEPHSKRERTYIKFLSLCYSLLCPKKNFNIKSSKTMQASTENWSAPARSSESAAFVDSTPQNIIYIFCSIHWHNVSRFLAVLEMSLLFETYDDIYHYHEKLLSFESVSFVRRKRQLSVLHVRSLSFSGYRGTVYTHTIYVHIPHDLFLGVCVHVRECLVGYISHTANRMKSKEFSYGACIDLSSTTYKCI